MSPYAISSRARSSTPAPLRAKPIINRPNPDRNRKIPPPVANPQTPVYNNPQ